jgi:hypothetical protein
MLGANETQSFSRHVGRRWNRHGTRPEPTRARRKPGCFRGAVTATAAGRDTGCADGPPTDGLEVVWAVSRLSLGRLEWETRRWIQGVAAADPFGFVPQGERVLRVRLEGLKPGTVGRVRAHTVAANDGETVTGEWKPFRTLDPAAGQTRFVMWNDTHVFDETIQALHQVTPAADFLVWNGDTCNDWTREDLLIPTLLNPGGCDISLNRPLLVAYGNHDVRGAHAFKMPGVVATPGGRPFYAFRSGPVAVICLHTGEDKPDDHPSFRGRVAFDVLRAEQARWLARSSGVRSFVMRPIDWCSVISRCAGGMNGCRTTRRTALTGTADAVVPPGTSRWWRGIPRSFCPATRTNPLGCPPPRSSPTAS